MHILITGGTGFIGSALQPALHAAGHRVSVLSRTERGNTGAAHFVTDLAQISDPIEAVINLAGASLADKRWSESYKAELRSSRIDTTQALGEALAAGGHAPAVFLSGSAIGYYGASDETVDESAPVGEGFAADLCRDWEASAEDAAGDARLCIMRLGVVFGSGGGAYQQMAMPFRFRFGNWIGSGHQALSWIHIDDVVAAMHFLLERDDLEGVFNLTAPAPTTSRGFCQAMQHVRRSIVSLPVPAFTMRLLMGQMADELLITGQPVLPKALLDAGHTFQYRTIDAALPVLEGRG